MAESIIKLAWIQFQHLHLGVVLVSRFSLFTEFLCLVSHSLAISRFWKPCLSSPSQQQPTPVFLPGESNRQKSLASYSPWGSQRREHYLACSKMCALAKENCIYKSIFKMNFAILMSLGRNAHTSQGHLRIFTMNSWEALKYTRIWFFPETLARVVATLSYSQFKILKTLCSARQIKC